MIVALFTILLFSLEQLRRKKRAAQATRYQYDLFRLRDDLRDYVIANPQMARSWLFAYLDSTITKSIVQLPDLSIWQLVALNAAYSDDDRWKRLVAQLECEMQKERNAEFRSIENRLMTLLVKYLSERHTALIASAGAVEIVSAVIHSRLKDLKKRAAKVAVSAPETSTLGEFAPA
jgi:hypothetical protein